MEFWVIDYIFRLKRHALDFLLLLIDNIFSDVSNMFMYRYLVYLYIFSFHNYVLHNFLLQAVIQLLEALNLFYSISKEESLDVLAVSSTSIYFISLLTGELGNCWSFTPLKFPLCLWICYNYSFGVVVLKDESAAE